MRKKIIVRILAVLILPALVIGVLALYSMIEKDEQMFARQFKSTKLLAEDTVQLSFNSFSLLRVDQRKIMLSNRIGLRVVMEIDRHNLDTCSFILDDTTLTELRFRDPRILMTEHRFIVADGSVPLLLTADVMWQKFSTLHVPRFSAIAAATDSTYVLRTYNTHLEQDVLMTIGVSDNSIHANDAILEKQIDGIFCVDGMLMFNEHLHTMVYVYFYRNQFITADPTLSKVERGRTIDLTVQANIKVDTYEVNGEQTRTFKSPPKMVNLKSTTDKQFLYIASNVKATNQQKSDFDYNYTIDRYDLTNRRYEGSFYLKPPTDRHQLKNFDFSVCDDKLVAIFDDVVIVYKIVVTGEPNLSEMDPK